MTTPYRPLLIAAARYAVVAIAASSSTPQAVDDLDALLAGIAAWPDAPASWQAATIRLPNHASEPLPCLRGTVEVTITDDEPEQP